MSRELLDVKSHMVKALPKTCMCKCVRNNASAMQSFSAYATASTALLVMVCYHAHEQRRQFYPTVRMASCIDLSQFAVGHAASLVWRFHGFCRLLCTLSACGSKAH